MNKITNPIIVEFPLRGEWFSPQTPGKRIPSHGTDRFGTRYAYDFLQVDWKRKGRPSYAIHPLRYLLFGAPLKKYYCWGQEVHAPCDGTIVQAEDGWRERPRTHLLTDLLAAFKVSRGLDGMKDGIRPFAGNYIIMECGDGVYAGLVHLQAGSIQVHAGQKVARGDVIGRVGHSGNSFGPHLHFQLMDSSDAASANGLPCAFEQYEVLQQGKWHKVHHGIPTDKDRIRFIN